MNISPNSSSKLVRIAKPFELVGVEATEIPTYITTGIPTSVVYKDSDLLQIITSASVSNYQLTPKTFGGAASTIPVIYASGNPTIATVNDKGFVKYVSQGDVDVHVTALGKTYSKKLTMSFTGGNVAHEEFVQYRPGTLGKHITDTIDTRISGKSPSTALRLFTQQDHANKIYARNPNVWCADLANVLPCMSPWNSSGGNTRAGTLISPRHIIFAAHYQINVGATVRFVTMDNMVIDRIMTAKLTHPAYKPYFPDITIGVLDADVDLPFAKVLPDNWNVKLPRLYENRWDGNLPALTLDQEEKALVTDVLFQYMDGYTNFRVPRDTTRLAFYEAKIGGDSGNPAIMIINAQPVLLTVWTYGGSGSGTTIAGHKTAINTMMNSLGGNYQLTEIDLSSFPSF